MTERSQHPLEHAHSFGQERKRPGEARTLVVIVITAAMMVVEIAAGLAFGSMALLADGLHMASHAAALSVTALAYVYARRYAHDERFSFGTGKVNALGGFTGAILLAVFALMMIWESVDRLIFPVPIIFDRAILVAVIGLLVNGASMVILGHHHDHDHGPDHAADHGHHDHGVGHGQDHEHGHPEGRHHRHDHNLRAAYLHVLADALTSLLAIFALLAAKYAGQVWMDPLMGIIGALVVARWSVGLIRMTSEVLLDRQAPPEKCDSIRSSLESDGRTRVTDLHLWSIGPGIYSLAVAVSSRQPLTVGEYRRRIPAKLGVVHATIEVNHDSTRGQPVS